MHGKGADGSRNIESLNIEYWNDQLLISKEVGCQSLRGDLWPNGLKMVRHDDPSGSLLRNDMGSITHNI